MGGNQSSWTLIVVYEVCHLLQALPSEKECTYLHLLRKLFCCFMFMEGDDRYVMFLTVRIESTISMWVLVEPAKICCWYLLLVTSYSCGVHVPVP